MVLILIKGSIFGILKDIGFLGTKPAITSLPRGHKFTVDNLKYF